MIGGYLYKKLDEGLERNLQAQLTESYSKIWVWNNGYLFHDNPFGGSGIHSFTLSELTFLSHDLLVKEGSNSGFQELDLEKDFLELYRKNGVGALNSIVSDFRMMIADRTKKEEVIFLISNRAGSGRIYFHKLAQGILFCSDLRCLLRIIPLNVNEIGLYSILKYGAIPEPMTISKNILAVPPAHYLRWKLGSNEYSIHPYFQYNFDYNDGQESQKIEESCLEPVKNILQKSAHFLSKYEPAMLLSGGIDSSLFANYLHLVGQKPFKAFYCSFGKDDPEIQFARSIAKRTNADFKIIEMGKDNAYQVLEDVVNFTDHPFADFSSLPMVFLLKKMRENLLLPANIIECNGGDDCFGFPALDLQSKFAIKHRFPKLLKSLTVALFKNTSYWKFESQEGSLARLVALADVHEINPLNYFLVQSPVNYLGMEIPREWDLKLENLMENTFSNSCIENEKTDYKAKITVRQLMHINSRLWTAKALSVGESVGLRILYPYIWLGILLEQGRLPWNAKINNGIVKWPLKKLLEEFMPADFIYREKSGFVPPLGNWLMEKDFNHRVWDTLLSPKGVITGIVPSRIFKELLSNALNGKRLRFPVLNFLWGAIFTEMWMQRHKKL